MSTESLYTDGSIEPQVNTQGLNSSDDALTSIAISLKRIADMLDPESNKSHTSYGEPLLEGLQNSITRGLQGMMVPR